MDRVLGKLNKLKETVKTNQTVDSDRLSEYGLSDDIKLREYQIVGVNWLIQCFHNNHGCILADEMGLGKTCQTISLLVYLHGSLQSSGPHLIVSPLSVLRNWQSELARFAPSLNVCLYTGDKEKRYDLQAEIKKDWTKINVILTTYEMCLKDESFLRKFSWHTLIVDEAHRLKNNKSLLHQTLFEFDIEHCVLLTGTPVQNNLQELYALLCFVAPNIFNYKYVEDFIERYTTVTENSTYASELHELLQPFILRRIKSEVTKDLPMRSEVVLYHGMSALQKKLYKAILTKDVGAFGSGSNRTSLMNILMQLRKCVNHPYIFDGIEPEPFQLGEHLVDVSGKLLLIDQLLSYLQLHKHKVLLFSQMTRMLDILQDYLGYRGYNYERLDGSVRGEERYLAVQNFNELDDNFVFLLSTKAGGQGLNLVAADTVIFVDSDFNPQNDLQAAARAHRIGQTRPVKVIRLIGRSSVEEVILQRAEAKLELTTTVIEGGQFSLQGGATSKEHATDNIQLQDILKFGVDKLFENESSTIETVDFDDILGSSEDGKWVLDQDDRQTQETLAAQSMEAEDEPGESTSNMYVFEGKDYSKGASKEDKQKFDQIIAAQEAEIEEEISEGRALRKTKTMTLAASLPELPTRTRQKLTPQQLEERKKKRLENAARKAEEAKKLQQKELEKKMKWWSKNGYESLSLELGSEGEEEEEDEEEEEGEDGQTRQMHYVVGDVTKPTSNPCSSAFIVHCCDDSGQWGTGGLFTAIQKRSSEPERKYQLAGEYEDLELGSTHLIPMKHNSDTEKSETRKIYVALIIAQHRNSYNQLSGIKLSYLSEGLQKLYKAAKVHKASVHLPRIGHNTRGFNWYGTEKLIYKYLVSRGIPTYIYYYPRKKPGYLKRRSSSVDSNRSKRGRSSSPKPSTSKPALTGPLPSFMQGVCVHFYMVPDDLKKRLTRYLITYDGDKHATIEDSTTHIVVPSSLTANHKKELKEALDEFPSVFVVTTEWMERSIWKQTLLKPSNYIVKLG